MDRYHASRLLQTVFISLALIFYAYSRNIFGYISWMDLAVIGISVLWIFGGVFRKYDMRSPWAIILSLSKFVLNSIAYLFGYRVRILRASDVAEVYRFRYQVYLDAGYIEPNESKYFVDEYDAFATHIVLLRNNRIVGAMRIVYPNNATGLPLDSYFHYERDEAIPYVELGRWIADPSVRKKTVGNSIASILILIRTYMYLLNAEYPNLLFFISPRLKLYLQRTLGIEIKELTQKPLLEKHIKSRSHMRGYFDGKQIIICSVQLKMSDLPRFLLMLLTQPIRKLLPQNKYTYGYLSNTERTSNNL